jgi:GNAT superfamily N-acetyltransferase
MSSKSSFTTKELSRETWHDFVDLFSRGGGWDHCFCMHFHRPRSLPKEQRLPTRAERGVRNCKQKRTLVDGGHAHGILVYVGEKPIGWCQYGRHEELPRVDNNRKYRALVLDRRISPAAKAGRRRAVGEPRLWRITCFVVDKKHRRQGIATAALKAALDSIRKQGGGIVEAYPISRWETRAFGNESTSGTLSMFKRQRFKVVAPLGATRFSSHVLVRRVL